jgi:membrane protease YdiL (CAAX protease family)
VGQRILNAAISLGLVVLYAVTFIALVIGAGWLFHALHIRLASPQGAVDPVTSLVETAVNFTCAAIATLLIALIRRRSPLDFGLRDQAWLRRAITGALAGAAAFGLLTALLIGVGVMHLRPSGEAPGDAVVHGLIWAAVFVGVGLFEESFIRGAPLSELTRGFGFVAAAAVTSSIFGLIHLTNGGEHPLGIANAVLVGVVWAYSVRVTGSLWWAIGFHAVWDWMESYLVGTADSGVISTGRLMVASPAGPDWLSGATAGPEGSALCTAVLIAALVALFWWARRRGTSAQNNAAEAQFT